MSEEKTDKNPVGLDTSPATGPGGLLLVEMTEDDMIHYITEEYLESMDPALKYDPMKLKSELLFLTIGYIEYYNKKNKSNKCRKRTTLYPMQIAMIILKLYEVRMIQMYEGECSTVSGQMLLAIYQEFGENEGIYMAQDRELKRLIQMYNGTITKTEVQQVIEYLENNSEVVHRSDSPTLIPVQNGIFDFETKQMKVFSPDIVFTSKCRVSYNPSAIAPVVIHNDDDGTDWEIGEWLEDMFDYDPDIVEVIWQILSALVRPNVKWEKCIWFYSTKGNNGKGTLCELMKNLVGKDMCASIKIADFKKEFMLEPLLYASAIVVDENDVGKFVDEAANFKAIITGDTITINRKHRIPVTFQPHMLQVQCINELPQFRDKSESLYRRQLIIGFKKSFTGRERKYIKHDYLNREEVLEYVLYRVLHMDHTEITETSSMKDMMDKYKKHNEPVRDFLEEILEETQLDFLPQSLLWDMFKSWSILNNPHGTLPKRNKFFEEMKDVMESNTEWIYHENPVCRAKLMYRYEPLLMEYRLSEWQRKAPQDGYMSCDKMNIKHRGSERKTLRYPAFTSTGNTTGDTENPDTEAPDTEDQDS